jgi:2-keto-3-deoxy-L-rhamnonate aldolase RhmA
MRINRLRERLNKPGPLMGVMADVASPRLIEMYGLLGFDWVLIDAEHDGVGIETCYAYAMAAEAAGIASLVRVPENRPEVILAYADTGVSGIIAPHVRSGADAERLVSAVRFPPHGHRGIAGSSRAANYGATQAPKEYFAAVHSQPVICALMEDGEAYDNAEAIIGHPGIEVVCLGTGDLAGSLGHPGEKGHPEVIERVLKASALARRHGKILNAAAGDAASLADAAKWGVRMVMNSNTGLITGAARAYLKLARETLPE